MIAGMPISRSASVSAASSGSAPGLPARAGSRRSRERQQRAQKTSRPGAGSNGTFAEPPHPVHVASHEGPEALRASRQALHRLGGSSPLESKNARSASLKTKGCPHRAHEID
jgi:hypothetical protein